MPHLLSSFGRESNPLKYKEIIDRIIKNIIFRGIWSLSETEKEKIERMKFKKKNRKLIILIKDRITKDIRIGHFLNNKKKRLLYTQKS